MSTAHESQTGADPLGGYSKYIYIKKKKTLNDGHAKDPFGPHTLLYTEIVLAPSPCGC